MNPNACRRRTHVQEDAAAFILDSNTVVFYLMGVAFGTLPIRFRSLQTTLRLIFQGTFA